MVCFIYTSLKTKHKANDSWNHKKLVQKTKQGCILGKGSEGPQPNHPLPQTGEESEGKRAGMFNIQHLLSRKSRNQNKATQQKKDFLR